MTFPISKNNIAPVILSGLAIAMIAGYRLLPHPWNFAPVTASAIFGGMVLSRRMAWIIPVIAMLISDLWIGISWVDMPFVYGSILIAVGIGIWIGKTQGDGLIYAGKILGGTILSSVIFYVITNFGSWLTLTMYPKTLSGLMMSYFNAIPFFQHSLAADLFFVTLFVASYALSSSLIKKLIPQTNGKS